MSERLGTGLARFVAITQKVILSSLCVCIVLVFLQRGVLPDASDTTIVAKLIEQFKGGAFYWDQNGEKPGLLDRWTVRHFEVQSKITAAKLLGEMEPKATEAVPVLLEALNHGPNDIDTGDGILPYRSTIAIALGQIGDTRAIGPLIEKLKLKETATLSPSHAGLCLGANLDLPVGCGHAAVVEALGMFGTQAKEAVPYIKALENDANDFRLKDAIEFSLEKIAKGD